MPGIRVLRRHGREMEIVANGNTAAVVERLRARSPEALTIHALTLEEIFVSTLQPHGAIAIVPRASGAATTCTSRCCNVLFTKR